MADIVLYNVPLNVEEMVKKFAPPDVRVKTCTALEHALSWIELLNVGVVISAFDIPVEEQRQIGEALWKVDPQNVFILLTEKRLPPSSFTFATRLSGADLIHVEDGGQRLSQLVLERLSLKFAGQEALRVLVVEDLDSPRDIIAAYVESIGAHEVEQASSAKEAFERLRDTTQSQITCVITDMRMPINDGNALIRWIRGDPQIKDLPVIVLTAYGTPECLVDSLEAGATGFLVKPPKRTDIQRELSRAVRIWRRRSDPRLLQPEEVPVFRKALEDRGL